MDLSKVRGAPTSLMGWPGGVRWPWCRSAPPRAAPPSFGVPPPRRAPSHTPSMPPHQNMRIDLYESDGRTVALLGLCCKPSMVYVNQNMLYVLGLWTPDMIGLRVNQQTPADVCFILVSVNQSLLFMNQWRWNVNILLAVCTKWGKALHNYTFICPGQLF